MYGDLFGDLPEAKNAKKSDRDAPPAQEGPSRPSAASAESSEQQQSRAASTSSAVPSVPVASAVSFVPTSALHRKRNKRPAPASAKPVVTRIVVQEHVPPSTTFTTLSTAHPPQPEQEPDALRHLHDNVRDPYDPLVPNDFLQYLERQKAQVERRRLEAEHQAALEEQRRLREQLYANPSSLVGDDYERRTMGRGRGVSNLPAWLKKAKDLP